MKWRRDPDNHKRMISDCGKYVVLATLSGKEPNRYYMFTAIYCPRGYVGVQNIKVLGGWRDPDTAKEHAEKHQQNL